VNNEERFSIGKELVKLGKPGAAALFKRIDLEIMVKYMKISLGHAHDHRAALRYPELELPYGDRILIERLPASIARTEKGIAALSAYIDKIDKE